MDRWAYRLPLAALRQVCHPALEVAEEQQPPVLVYQEKGLHPVHEGAGFVSAYSCAKAVVPTGVPTVRRLSGAWYMSTTATDAAAAVASEYTAHLTG
jgi:hypothetical protein